jgi:single stranded DNA-binding protein
VAEKTVKKGSQLYIVGKIKTRSYVDKEGNNKYITEILADTLLLLDKKQGSGNSGAQTDQGNNVALEKGSSGSEVNEPATKYQSANESNNKNWPDKNNANNDDFGADSFHKEGPGSTQDEDDLPF